MANALILVFASVGLVGIVFILGVALAIGSFFFVTALAYPVSTPDGPGRIVGWPFLVAYFDSAGRDYVGFITYVGALGNFVFWLLVPQFFLGAYARRVVSRHVV
jgi:hypothetical protein